MRRATIFFMALMCLTFGVVGYTAGSRQAFAPQHVGAADDCQNFTATGHQVCGAFLQYWTANGGLAQQGYPISDPFNEVSTTDGKTYSVQYFERAVFEVHPELPAGSNVLLSLLGVDKYKTKYNGKAPSGAPGATAVIVPTMGTTPTATRTATTPATAAPTAKVVANAPPGGDDNAYKAYLTQKYSNVGNHKIDLKELTINRSGSGSNSAVIVSFAVTSQDSLTYFNDVPRADLQAWGTALLADLKAKYPNTYVIGDLQNSFYSSDYVESTDCGYTSDSYTSGQGWYMALYFVKAYYIPNLSDDSVKVCFAK